MNVNTVVCMEFWNKPGTLAAGALYVDKPGEGGWRPQQAYRVRREGIRCAKSAIEVAWLPIQGF